MFWKNAEFSLRARMVGWSVASTAAILALAGLVIFFVARGYVYGRNAAEIRRVLDDLTEEYVEYGGLTEAFRRCIDDDVSEHDARTTRIRILSPSGDELYATAPLRKRDHRRISRGQSLADGSTIVLDRDVEDIHHFLLFLGWMLVGMFVLVTSSSGVSAYVIGGRILRLNRLVEEKNRAYAELRHLTDDIAHDLRTPLTRLSMAAETTLSAGGSKESLVEQVMDETNAMLSMINTMLEISQTDAKIDRTPREEIDLGPFIRHMGELYSPVAEDSGLNLEVCVPEMPVLFSGHRGKLQQLVGNLLENALKYTPRGGSVRVGLSEEDREIVLTVVDTGCGISTNDLPHIFQRFWRADASRHMQGNGLGLSLVHAIVTSYGGRISCQSEVGKGSTFTVALPLDFRG